MAEQAVLLVYQQLHYHFRLFGRHSSSTESMLFRHTAIDAQLLLPVRIAACDVQWDLPRSAHHNLARM